MKVDYLVSIILTTIVLTAHGKPHIEPTSREDLEHFANDPERHDVSFDHNAFLGSETAQEYAKLTPEQSREKLKEIVKKIDVDHNGKINDTELKNWIKYVATMSQEQITNKRWNDVNRQGSDPLPWKEYHQHSYGNEEDRLADPASAEEYKRVLRQDRRRWEAADVNKDDALSKEEFFNFLNPEEKPHMRDAIIDEILDSVDTDKDGKISEKEYLDDLARAYQHSLKPGEPEPEWVGREKEQFQKYRDVDHNGFMDRAEVGEWIMPSEYDPVEAEAQHLFYHADMNKDDVLTEQEILAKQDLFISSQATNYGIALEQKDEL